jgi:hypothetical protein
VSFAARLIHRLALVSPAGAGDAEDAGDLDDYGHAIPGTPVVELLRGLVQPRRSEEVASFSQAGVEIGDHIVYLLPRRIPGGAYLTDADEDGVVPGGRRWDVIGVRSFEFGRSPHLEVDCRLVGATEAPDLGS